VRISIVPAQITTVEDKIAGNMSVQQAVLLGVPILFGFIAAVVFPPSGQFVAYKVAIVAVLFVICGTLALRIKERIVAQWLVLFAVYMARPEYYVYDKNSSYLRPDTSSRVVLDDKEVSTEMPKKRVVEPAKMASKEFARLQRFATDERVGIKYVVGRKGELNVRITEAE
jgi:hypothetical protein